MVLYVKVVLSTNGLPFGRDHILEVYPSGSEFQHFSIHYPRSGREVEPSAAHEFSPSATDGLKLAPKDLVLDE